MIENYIFENALEDICWSCGCKEDCSGFDKDCPLFEKISVLKDKCDELKKNIDELALDAKNLEPEYDPHSDAELMPERDQNYWIGSKVMHF